MRMITECGLNKFFPKWVKIKKRKEGRKESKKEMLLAGSSLCNLVFCAIAGQSVTLHIVGIS